MPANEIELPAVRTGGVPFSVSQAALADPECSDFDLAMCHQKPE